MDTKTNVKNITIKDIVNIFVQRLWIIMLVLIIVVGGLYTIDTVTYDPQYSSTATMYILRQSNEEITAGDVASDFSLALKVVNDCTYFLKGHTVLDNVRSQLNLNMSYNALHNSISTYNPSNTRILEVTVVASTPDMAKQIVDSVCREGVVTINQTMGFEQINLYELGTLNTTPCNKTNKMSFLLFGLAAAAITFLLFVIIYLADDTIKTEEDIDKYLGLSILGDIPNAESTRKKGYGYGYGINNESNKIIEKEGK